MLFRVLIYTWFAVDQFGFVSFSIFIWLNHILELSTKFLHVYMLLICLALIARIATFCGFQFYSCLISQYKFTMLFYGCIWCLWFCKCAAQNALKWLKLWFFSCKYLLLWMYVTLLGQQQYIRVWTRDIRYHRKYKEMFAGFFSNPLPEFVNVKIPLCYEQNLQCWWCGSVAIV